MQKVLLRSRKFFKQKKFAFFSNSERAQVSYKYEFSVCACVSERKRVCVCVSLRESLCKCVCVIKRESVCMSKCKQCNSFDTRPPLLGGFLSVTYPLAFCISEQNEGKKKRVLNALFKPLEKRP